MNEATDGVGADRILVQPIAGAPDLVHLRQDVLTFLSSIDEHVVADAVLVVVMLAGDACRTGAPRVMLRLHRPADDHSLRVEVDAHRPERERPAPEDYRTGILDRMTSDRGVEHADGVTTTWAEIPLVSHAA